MARSLLPNAGVSKYQPDSRLWPRLVPSGSVTVSIYGPGNTQAYGVLSNISEGGAQFVAGVLFESGSRVLLRIGFNPEEPFVVPGEVVWSRDDGGSQHETAFVHGVHFRIEDAEHQARLAAMVRSPEFQNPVLPGQESDDANGLDTMLNELGDELGKLGEQISKDS